MKILAILENKKVVPTTDLRKWLKFVQHLENRIVQDDLIKEGVRVSTIFTGMNFGWASLQLWFQTLVIGGKFDQEVRRYEFWEDAIKGHNHVVAKVKRHEQ